MGFDIETGRYIHDGENEMNEKEFYDCFTISREKVDEMISGIAVELIFNLITQMTEPIKEEVRNHPDDERVKQSFRDISEYSKMKVFEHVNKSLADAMNYSFARFDAIMEMKKKFG